MEEEKLYYVYLLSCKDNTLYCGYTTNIEKRVSVHNKGKGAKYTKIRRPVTLVYYEKFKHKSEALKREYGIKQYSRKEKLNLIGNNKDIPC